MDGTGCSICGEPLKARGWCLKHYRRWQRHGNPGTRLRIRHAGTVEDRWWARVDKNGPGGCWIWTGALYWTGYGQFPESIGKTATAHCWGYQRFVGPIPDGLELDHLCRVRACVRFDHLEPVTHGDNVRRGSSAKWLGQDCAIVDCDQPAKLHGLCRKHYKRQWRASRR